jgi:YbbR domain-containing protein
MIVFLRHFFFRDFWLKLLSLAIAVMIWLTIWFAIRKDVAPGSTLTGPIAEQTYYNVPVRIIFSAADVHNVKVDPIAVEVRIRGEARLLQAVRPEDIHAVVDLTGIESARSLSKRIEISTPAGITLVEVVPGQVDVTVPPKL